MDPNREYTKEVRFEHGEYLALFNGELVGYYRSRHEAEMALSLVAINYYSRH